MILIFYNEEAGAKGLPPLSLHPQSPPTRLRFAPDNFAVRSKLKCPLFVAHDLSGF
jgi:hypothetical protein